MCKGIVIALIAGAAMRSSADQPSKISPELLARAVKIARRCVDQTPERYKSVWGSPLDFDRAYALARPVHDALSVAIPEKDPKGKPQGVDLEVNFKSGVCTRLPQD